MKKKLVPFIQHETLFNARNQGYRVKPCLGGDVHWDGRRNVSQEKVSGPIIHEGDTDRTVKR